MNHKKEIGQSRRVCPLCSELALKDLLSAGVLFTVRTYFYSNFTYIHQIIRVDFFSRLETLSQLKHLIHCTAVGQDPKNNLYESN